MEGAFCTIDEPFEVCFRAAQSNDIRGESLGIHRIAPCYLPSMKAQSLSEQILELPGSYSPPASRVDARHPYRCAEIHPKAWPDSRSGRQGDRRVKPVAEGGDPNDVGTAPGRIEQNAGPRRASVLICAAIGELPERGPL